MTTTTLPMSATACMFHGLLNGDRDCPRCGRRAYDLADDGDRATVKAFRAATNKSRVRTLAIIGAVVGNVVQSALLFAAAGVLDVSIVSPATVIGAGLGACVGWFARPLAVHRLDGQLKL